MSSITGKELDEEHLKLSDFALINNRIFLLDYNLGLISFEYNTYKKEVEKIIKINL